MKLVPKNDPIQLQSLRPEIEAMDSLVDSLARFEPIKNPKYVGGYRNTKDGDIYVQFHLQKKPKWIHRQFMRILLGFYWVDNK
jgi:hypothetical protein